MEGFRIRWLPNQVDPRYVQTPTNNDPVFQITIIDDDIPEPPGREYFEIDLTLNPTGNNRNGFFFPSAVGRVTIIDDDTRKFLLVRLGKLDLLFLISQFQDFGVGRRSVQWNLYITDTLGTT